MLERKVLIPDVAAGAPEAVKLAMSEVRDSSPKVGRDLPSVDGGSDANAAVAALRNILSAVEPPPAADRVDDEIPELGDLLRRASERPR